MATGRKLLHGTTGQRLLDQTTGKALIAADESCDPDCDCEDEEPPECEDCPACDEAFCGDVVSITVRDLQWFCGDIVGCTHTVEEENIDLEPIECTGDPLPNAVFTTAIELFSTAVTPIGGASCTPGESSGIVQITLMCGPDCEGCERWQMRISYTPECGENDLNFVSADGPLVTAGSCSDIFGHIFDMYIIEPSEECATVGNPIFLVDMTVEVN